MWNEANIKMIAEEAIKHIANKYNISFEDAAIAAKHNENAAKIYEDLVCMGLEYLASH